MMPPMAIRMAGNAPPGARLSDDRARTRRATLTRGDCPGRSPGHPAGRSRVQHSVVAASPTLYHTGSRAGPPRERRTGGNFAARPVPPPWSERTTPPEEMPRWFARLVLLTLLIPSLGEPRPGPGRRAPAVRVHPAGGPLGPSTAIPDYLKFIARGAAGRRAGRLLRRPLLEPRPHAPVRRLSRPFPGPGAGRAGRLVRGPERRSSTRAASRSSATSTSSSWSATPTARTARRASSSSTATSGTRRCSGPGPSPTPSSLLEKNADGSPIKARTYAIGGMNEHWACLRNPDWQAVLKAWVRQGIRRGAGRLHRQLLLSPQLPLRALPVGVPALPAGAVPARGAAGEVRDRRPRVAPVPRDRLVAPGGRDDAAPAGDAAVLAGLQQAGLRRRLRAVRPLAQARPDPRPVEPPGEPLADRRRRALPPARRALGPGRDVPLVQHRRRGELHRPGQGRPRRRDACRPATSAAPSTTSRSPSGKYEGTRIRVGHRRAGRQRRRPDGVLHAIHRPRRPRGDRPLLPVPPPPRPASIARTGPTPRSPCCSPARRVHRGDVAAVEAFRKLGQALLDAHVLFDVWPDDQFPAGRAARYAKVVDVDDAARHGRRGPAGPPQPVRGARRPSGSPPAGPPRSEGEIDLHFVNYNRTELPPGPDGQPSLGAGIADEKPLRRLRDRRRHRPARRGDPAVRPVPDPRAGRRAGPGTDRGRATVASGSPSPSSSSMAWPGSSTGRPADRCPRPDLPGGRAGQLDEYAGVVIATKDGALYSGRIEREDDRVVVLRPPPPAEVLTIPKAEIVERRRLDQSNMPAGMLNVLREEEILDLLAYLLGDPRPRSPKP